MLYNPCTKGLCVAWRARACSLLQAIQRLAQPELITDNSHLTPPRTMILAHPIPTQTLTEAYNPMEVITTSAYNACYTCTRLGMQPDSTTKSEEPETFSHES